MDVILMENVENLGSVGDKVSVKSGFARNYLVPQGKAKMATAANLAEFEARRARTGKKRRLQHSLKLKLASSRSRPWARSKSPRASDRKASCLARSVWRMSAMPSPASK